MSNQQTNVPSEPPPAYDSILDQRRPQDEAPAGGNAAGGASTTSAGGAAAAAAAPATTSSNNGSSNAQSAGVDANGNRRPRRGDSAHEELDVEEEDRPLPPGWVIQYSEEHDREFSHLIID